MNNEIEKGTYIWKNLFWSIMFLICYRNLCFRNVSAWAYSDSNIFFVTTVIICTITGMVFTYSFERNKLSIFSNVVMPFEIYTLISYYNLFAKAILFISSISICFALFVLIRTMSRQIPKKRKTKKLLICRGTYSFYVVFTLCMLALIIPIAGVKIWGYSLYNSNVPPAISKDNDKWSIQNNIDILVKLDEPTWKTLKITDKLTVLQTVANVETRYLGLPKALTVHADNLGEGILGQYDDQTNVITIDVNYLLTCDAHEALDTVAHEAYHAYEHELCQLYDNSDESSQNLMLFRRIECYRKEFQDYCSGEKNEDFIKYYCQYCEEDSRAYAEAAVSDYYEKIYQHMNAN